MTKGKGKRKRVDVPPFQKIFENNDELTDEEKTFIAIGEAIDFNKAKCFALSDLFDVSPLSSPTNVERQNPVEISHVPVRETINSNATIDKRKSNHSQSTTRKRPKSCSNKDNKIFENEDFNGDSDGDDKDGDDDDSEDENYSDSEEEDEYDEDDEEDEENEEYDEEDEEDDEDDDEDDEDEDGDKKNIKAGIQCELSDNAGDEDEGEGEGGSNKDDVENEETVNMFDGADGVFDGY
jgi:hypothetical protein